MNIEIYLLGEVLYKIKNRELKLERTNREDVKVKFTQTEIDVIVKCLGMYAGQALAKIDSKRMYVSFKIKHDFLT